MTKEKKYTLKELKKLLNDKQKKFCHRWIIDYNNTKSYMHAYPDCKYDSAAVCADRLLRNVKVQQYIEYIKGDLEKESGITKLKVMNELAKIAFTSIAHLHNTWIELKEFEELTDEQKAAIESTERRIIKRKVERKIEDDNIETDVEETIEQIKIKLYSKIQATAEINKMMGYNAPQETKNVHQFEGDPFQKIRNNAGIEDKKKPKDG